MHSAILDSAISQATYTQNFVSPDIPWHFVNQGAMLRGNKYLSIQVEASSLLIPAIVISESECKRQTHLEQIFISHPPTSDLSCLEAFFVRNVGECLLIMHPFFCIRGSTGRSAKGLRKICKLPNSPWAQRYQYWRHAIIQAIGILECAVQTTFSLLTGGVNIHYPVL